MWQHRGAIDRGEWMRKIIFDRHGDICIAEALDHGAHEVERQQRHVAACGVRRLRVRRDSRQSCEQPLQGPASLTLVAGKEHIVRERRQLLP